MEIEEEPINSADPAEDVLPARSPETELEKVPAAGESTPNRPDETCPSTVVPRETEATPATPSPSPGATPETEERAPVVEHRAPTPEGYATPTGSLSTTGSPTRLRASPKRKQLSSPDGSEIAAGLVSAVKRHCGSTSEPIHTAQCLSNALRPVVLCWWRETRRRERERKLDPCSREGRRPGGFPNDPGTCRPFTGPEPGRRD